jgi:citrate synthase
VDWMDAGETAKRLGVKPATLYAYVSRGVLRRHRGEDGRSRFDAAEVERLARRGRPRRGPAPAEVVIESQITALGADRPYYRGRDALELAGRFDFEAVAGWLWTGSDPADGGADPGPLPSASGGGWRAAPEAVAAGRAAQAGLPADVLPLERLQVIVPALGATDPRRLTFDPPAVVAVGQSLIAGMVDCLPGSASAAPGHAIAARLWPRLTPAPATPGLVDALRVALVLLADHELAASTLAARVAASVRADPYAVVSAGLAAMGGALHGGASLGVEALLAEVRHGTDARQALGLRLRRGERIPGFGHSVYKGQDGRGAVLLDRVRAAAPGHGGLTAADAVLADAGRRRLPELNVDFALAVLTTVAGMASGAGEAIFAIARTVGWLAHALEEYANPTRLRLRAVYVGQSPPS